MRMLAVCILVTLVFNIIGMAWTILLVAKVQSGESCVGIFPCDNITPHNRELDAMLWLLGHLIKYFAIQYFYIIVFKPKNVKVKKNFEDLSKRIPSSRTSVAPSFTDKSRSTDRSLTST
jgi:hypothetical protein